MHKRISNAYISKYIYALLKGSFCKMNKNKM